MATYGREGEIYSGQTHNEIMAHGTFSAVMLLLTIATATINSLCIATA